jgi:hypothetical protein
MGAMAMDECKDCQRKSYIAQTNCKHDEGRYGRLPLYNVYIGHGFLPRTGKFEKTNSKTFFYELIEGFVHRGFGNPWEPLSIEYLWNLIDDFMQLQASEPGCHKISRTK